MQIRSTANPRVKELVRIQTEPAARRQTGLFCLESLRELERARSGGFKLLELYICPPVIEGRGLEALLPGQEAIEISRPVLEKVAYRRNPEGFIAVMQSRTTEIGGLRWLDDPLLIVCSGVEKPGNVGAILRSADAAGATGVLIDRPDFDLFNPNCVRASTGAVFSVPVVLGPRQGLYDELKRRGVRIAAATPEAQTSYTAQDWTGPVAFIMGAEDEGLDTFWRQAADLAVHIPQRGTVDSLNVSVTAALLLFEAARQRAAGSGRDGRI